MSCSRCGVCCRETEMLLCTEDIERLERIGYPRDFFVIFDEEGYARLRNLGNICAFFNAENKTCNVYRFRPSGCRLYPVIYDEQKGIVLDHDCGAPRKYSQKHISRTGRKVISLLEKIDAQSEKRRRHFI